MPVVLIHKEKYGDKGKAFGRERFLKSLWGARDKKKIKDIYLAKNSLAKSILKEN